MKYNKSHQWIVPSAQSSSTC